DRVTVLRDGRTIDTRPMASVSREALIQLMVGRELSAVFPKKEVSAGEVVLELRRLGSRAAGVKDATLDVRAGEIVGLAGLVGSGRTELAETLFGLAEVDEGEMLLRGRAVRLASPAQAIESGIAYVPEDRRRHGVVLEMAVSANVTLASLAALSRFGALDRRRETEMTVDYVERLGIKTPATFTPVAFLSGGNQQKVALSRWLATKPSLLILDEPTQGVDVGAKSEIHALMVELAQQGVAILMISSEMPEILGMSDRIAVMRAGTIAGVLSRHDATQPRLLALALGEEARRAAGHSEAKA
ncbi:MAG: sugar ABC transporter ATP-binding protein, partial [Vicinamibacteria bacterium]